MRLTRRGGALLVVALGSLGIGYSTGLPLMSVLGAILLGAVLAAAFVVLRPPEVVVDRRLYPDRVSRGRPALARLLVRNPMNRRLDGLLAADAVGGDVRTVRLRPLPPGGEATHHYEVPTTERGLLVVGPLTLHRVDAFGLARSARSSGATAVLRVHPRRLAAGALASGHPRHHHEVTTIDESLRGSMDLKDVREYVPGDETRHVHWKATARTGRLMVRDMADPEQPGFTLLLDDRLGAFAEDDFEEAVDVAASLLAAAATAGHRARLVTSGGADVATMGGTGAARHLLDELSELVRVADGGSPLVPAALERARASGGGLAVITAASADLRALATLRGRYGAVFVIFVSPEDRHPVSVAGARVLHARNADELVRRWNEVIA